VCRRRILLNYFGQETASDCHNCDVCQHPPQLFDGTQYVQMALSAIIRANQMVSMHTCIDILCGIPSEEVGKQQYYKLKTYGVGSAVPAKDWRDYLLQMLQMGYIEVMYDQHNHLRVTELGKQVLYGERQAMLAVIRREVQPPKVKRKQPDQKEVLPGLWNIPQNGPEEDKDLFEALRQLRLRIAQQKGEPPFVIMSDKVLHQLATYKPTTLMAFGNINGIGEFKCATYGPVFLPVIIQHSSGSGSED
jgi:ATP-dependent DNA helicase RecQ